MVDTTTIGYIDQNFGGDIMTFREQYSASDIKHWGVPGMKWGVRKADKEKKKLSFRKTQSKKEKKRLEEEHKTSKNIKKHSKQEAYKPPYDKNKDYKKTYDDNKDYKKDFKKTYENKSKPHTDKGKGATEYDKIAKNAEAAMNNATRTVELASKKNIKDVRVKPTSLTVQELINTIGSAAYTAANVMNIKDSVDKLSGKKRPDVEEEYGKTKDRAKDKSKK